MIVQPHPGGGLTFVASSLQTMYGTLSSAWQLDGRTMTLDVTIPANTTATVKLLNADIDSVTMNTIAVNQAKEVASTMQDGTTAIVQIGSGQHRFVYERK